jgi:hypothetical protein
VVNLIADFPASVGRNLSVTSTSDANPSLSSNLRFSFVAAILPLPAKCQEVRSEENAWQFMRENEASNSIFISFDDIVEHGCDAWNTLADQPWCSMSIGLRDWAYGS